MIKMKIPIAPSPIYRKNQSPSITLFGATPTGLPQLAQTRMSRPMCPPTPATDENWQSKGAHAGAPLRFRDQPPGLPQLAQTRRGRPMCLPISPNGGIGKQRADTQERPYNSAVNRPACRNRHKPVGAGLCACPHPFQNFARHFP
jgi:hypothetical protein